MKNGRIGVVMGGTSAEREVSLRTGQSVAAALEEAGREVARIELGPDVDTVDAIRSARVDVVFLALHGRLGEDGCIQGLLEILGIPYTGSSVMASALAMDKLKSKELFRLHNVPTPPYYVFDGANLADVEEVHGSFGYPVVVKPRREGSSFGISKATNPAELARAIELARRFDQGALVERFISGKEISVGILNGRVLGAIEIAPKTGMYDYHAKYTAGVTEYFMPARLAPTRYRGVLNLAERAAQALDTTGAVRVDLLVTEGQNEYVLEVNTLPGMTPTSLLPKIAGAAGYSFSDLCVAIVEPAIRTEIIETEPAERSGTAAARPAGELPLAVAV